MHNLNDKPASSGGSANASSAGAPGAQAAQPTAFPKAGDARAADALGSSAAASAKPPVGGAHDAVAGAASAGDDIVKRLVEGAHAAIDKLADAAGPTVDRIAGALSNPSARASDLLDQAGDKTGAWIADVRDIVRERPIAAIAVALAAGAIYARLTSAPSRDPRDGLDD